MEKGNKTVWFNSRYYRANLLWEKGTFALGISIFSTRAISPAYLEKAGDGNQFLFYTLPVVDGFMWSEGLDRAGLRIVRLDKDGDKEELTLGPSGSDGDRQGYLGSFRRRLKKAMLSRSPSMRPASR